jgi:hypothetical protein
MSEIQIPEIPEINVPDIYIPEVTPPPILKISVPGCTYTHRDLQNTGNLNLLLVDKKGVSYSCAGEIPHFYPMNYEPDKLVVIEEAPAPESQQPDLPKTEQPEIPKTEEKKEETFTPCPGPNDQRVADYRNEKKLERVSGHKVGLSGECITLYEPVDFIEQYLPTPATAVSTAAIALIAASSPLLLSVIKPAVKNIFKKLTAKKKKEE